MKYALGFLLLIACCALADTASESSFPKNLNVITRTEWGANPPVAEMKAHKPEFITIHHTGTKQNPGRTVEDKLRGLQKFSQREDQLASGKTKPAWPDVPYHFYISVDGKLAEGRDLKFVGDTNTEYDPTGHLLVTLEGNFQEEKPSDAQMKTTRQLVRFLAKRYKVPASKIGSHKDYAKTACPGENLQMLLPELRDVVKATKTQ
ncbi:MAG: N-acetylmuramoyl-L-alanine amidase [Verrucomicrobia bacterium]|nr:N-acetylmuramoyl-L-alanine amidase [Verrucomicrobiota bacterium]